MKFLDKIKIIGENIQDEEHKTSFRQTTQIILSHEISSQKSMIDAVLDSKNPDDFCVELCWALIHFPRKIAIPAMKRILSEESRISIKIAACEVLGFFRSKSSAPIFIKIAMQDKNTEMRRIAIYNLGRILDGRAIRPLASLLEDPQQDVDILIETLETLAYLNARNTISVMIGFLKHPSAKVRFWAIFALSHLGNLTIIPHLEKLLHDTEEVEGWWSVAKEAENAITSISARNYVVGASPRYIHESTGVLVQSDGSD
jgi:HEAT repeat protein